MAAIILGLGLGLGLGSGGCGDDATLGDGGIDATAVGDGSIDAAVEDFSGVLDLTFLPDLVPADLTMSCAASGQSCATRACCVGSCDPTSKTCVAACTAVGGACTSPTQCCTLVCTGGKCGTTCKQDGTACGASSECCGGNCTGGTCQPVVSGGCVTLGNKCVMPSDCCSKNCQAGLCEPPGGGCNALGDVCYKGTDCCSGLCVIPSGKTAGTCQAIKSGGCTLDGEPCTGCSNCCSRVCAPTLTGGVICQIAGGCRLQNDICYKDSDCCGAPGSGLPGDGLVHCEILAGSNPPVGTCSQPSGGGVCDPEGNVCGIKPSQACGGNAREDCCDCMPPKYNCCKLDKAGVPRCYGGSTTQCPNGYTGVEPCCIKAGNQCTFSSECCGGAPCVPDSMGVLRCGSMCVQQGGVCTSTSDCCAGLPCVIPQGQITGTCGGSMPMPDGGTLPDGATAPDGGPTPDLSGDMWKCSLLGQSCKVNSDCCGGYVCDGPDGLPCNGRTGCSCIGIIG